MTTRAIYFMRAIVVAGLVMAGAAGSSGATLDPALVALHKRSFFAGREYFVLRSGPAKLIVQADEADLGPAVMYLLFDADDNHQSRRKEQAFNFADGQGMAASALEVVLGGFPFTAIGHQTRTRWTMVDGVPAVEVVWWAGGVRVTEHLLAMADQGVFLRRIQLSADNLGGPESPAIRLALPPGPCKAADGWLMRENARCNMALGMASAVATRILIDKSTLEVGPLSLTPGQAITVDTLLEVGIPRNGSSSHHSLTSTPAADGTAVFNITGPMESSRRAWAETSSVQTDDATVREIFDKARYGLAGMVGDAGVMDAGIFEYGTQWVRDTSNTLLGVVHAGQFELARRGFAYILGQMVNADGCTMIASGFDKPDREQFDQMGELLHALKAYRDWTGDDSLIREHRAKLLAMIERPLRPEFRDATGMVHNRREFWERTFDDAYELVYQMYVIVGLRDAAALAGPLGATDRAARWLGEADRIQQAMLELPGKALVENGHLIKRRAVTGEPVWKVHLGNCAADVPMQTERVNLTNPDATLALPVAFGLVPPQSALARNALDDLEKLRDGRWFGGGYERYHSSGQCDQPGPWSFATCFILRAQHEAGDFTRSRRTLEWLNTVQGGRTGSWFEAIPLLRSQAPSSGILPWTSGEISLFTVRHLLGVRFEGDRVILKPALYPNSPPVIAKLRFRHARMQVEIPAAGPVAFAMVDGQRVDPRADGAIELPASFAGGRIVIETLPVARAKP